jgi:zinc transporter ZupT
VATWTLIQKLASRKTMIATAILGFVFLLSGGVGAFIAYINGAHSFEQFVNGLTFPFFAGFLLIGFFGFLKMYRERDNKTCLYGLLIMVIAYGCIEVLFQSCGGI